MGETKREYKIIINFELTDRVWGKGEKIVKNYSISNIPLDRSVIETDERVKNIVNSQMYELGLEFFMAVPLFLSVEIYRNEEKLNVVLVKGNRTIDYV